MNRFFRYAAYLTAILQISVAVFVMLRSYSSQETLVAFLLLILPLLSLVALYLGPDLEERRLTRKLNKARMEQELADLKKKKK